MARLAGQKAPGSVRLQPRAAVIGSCAAVPSFFLGAGDLNTGLSLHGKHSLRRVVSTAHTVLRPLSTVKKFSVNQRHCRFAYCSVLWESERLKILAILHPMVKDRY